MSAFDMTNPCTLLIGSKRLLAAWNARAGTASRSFRSRTPTSPRALEAIGTRLPEVVVIEQGGGHHGPRLDADGRLHGKRLPSRAVSRSGCSTGSARPIDVIEAGRRASAESG